MTHNISTVILIPAFNSAGTLGPTLGSIQSQESLLSQISAVYLADDCSTDDTVSVAETAWRASIPLRILRADRNVGERDNVNSALATIEEQMDWVLILHSDDIAKPNWLSMMAARMEACEPTVASICSSWDTLWSDGSISSGEDDPAGRVEVIRGTTRAVRDTLLKGCWWHLSGAAIRVDAIDDLGGFAPTLPQLGDWEWLLRCLERGWSVEYVPRTLIVYRQHQGSVSSHSFRMDRDIREGLDIVQKYGHHLSRSDFTHYHMRGLQSATRRAARAMLQRDTRGFMLSCQTMGLVLQSLLRLSSWPIPNRTYQ